MADRDSWNDPQPESAAPVKKKGMSGCMLATLIVGGVGLVGMVVCCGVAGWIGSMFVPTVTKVPAEITAVGRKVLNTDVVADFSPDNAITIDNMFLTMRIAEFKHKEGKGEMMMGNVVFKIGDANQTGDQSRKSAKGLKKKSAIRSIPSPQKRVKSPSSARRYR